MRYEAKHKYLKKTAPITGNFKNIAKTVACCHQRTMCFKMTALVNFLESEPEVGPGMFVHDTCRFSFQSLIIIYMNISYQYCC